MARARVHQLGELGEDVRHLVAAFAAADVDHHVGVGPAGEGLLRDGLARPEPPGDHGRAALRDREERVEDPLARHQRQGGVEFAGVRPALAHGPGLPHPDRPVAVEPGDLVVDGQRPVRDVLHGPAHPGGDEDPVVQVVLANGPQHVPRAHLRAGTDLGHELPALPVVDAGDGEPAGDEVAASLGEERERALDPVVDRGEEPRTELHAEGLTRVLNDLAGPEAGRVLVDLDDRDVLIEPDHLARERLLADPDHVVHLRPAQSAGVDHRPRDPDHFTLDHCYRLSTTL